MEDFNAYWATESARRRKRWPSRYKTILKAHLSPEEIKERVYGLREHPSVLSQRHICDSNPIISPEDNQHFSEESLRERLESFGADTKTFSMTINVSAKSPNKPAHVVGRTYNYVREVVDIHFGEIAVRIKYCYRDNQKDFPNYYVYPYIGMDIRDCIELGKEQFRLLDTAMLLIELEADNSLRKEELLYYLKKQRIDNMSGTVAEDITFKLLDDEKLKEKVKNCLEKNFDEERMFREVARPWLIATKKYITLVTEANRDTMWPICDQVKSAIKEIDKGSLVFLTESNDLVIDMKGNTCCLEDLYGWKRKKITFHFFSDFPRLTIEFRGICTKALVGYLRQAAGFNKSMIDYLKKARSWYRQFKNLDTKEYSYDVVLPQTNRIIMGTNYKYIKKLTIPDTATFINDEAFCGLTNLTDITIPQSVCYIGASAFEDCHQLRSVHLPDILPVVRYATFRNCHHLQKIDFPSTLIGIEEEAFAKCYRLKTVSFPESLKLIRSYAFRSCLLLEDLHFNSRNPANISIENNAFDKYVFKTAIVFVPKGCEEAYRNSKSFAKFQHICSIE